jgi:uncharacterized protein (TIGR00730 family)
MIPDKRTTTTVGLTTDEVKKICRGTAAPSREDQLLCVVQEELAQGFAFIKQYPRMVTIFGSARTSESDPYYEAARMLGSRIAGELKLPVGTGGGPGIMEAANRGAQEAGGASLGIGIKLMSEQKFNNYVTESMIFHFFFTRKVIMSYSAGAFVYFPGGFGTLNEFFEIITLLQTGKIPPAPVYLFGSDYWNPILNEIIKNDLEIREYIDRKDEKLFVITDSYDDIVNGIQHFQE